MRFLKTTIPMMVVLISLIVPLAAWGLAQGYPDIYMQASPATKDVPAGGSATITVSITSQEGFEGKVQLNAENVPAGITVTFDPNPIDVSAYGQGDANMTVSTTSDISTGSVTLTIVGTSKEQFNLQEGLNNVKKSIPITIMTTSPTTTKTTTTTTTSTSTSQTLTTSTPTISTKTSAEAGQVADYTLPIMTAVAVIALLAVATIALRRRK